MKKILMIFLLLLAPSHTFAQIKVALTFDDLPRVGRYTKGETPQSVILRILNVLNKHHIRGVIAFTNGERLGWGTDSEKVIDQWIKSGHLLGNHTWSHPDLHTSSVMRYLDEIQRNDRILSQKYPKFFEKIFRFPFLHEGETLEKRDAIRDHLFESGYKTAQVTIDFNEYQWNDPYWRCAKSNNQEKLLRLKETFVSEATENLRGAEVLSKLLFEKSVMHIALIHPFEFDSLMLDETLTTWRKQGVEFIPLKDALLDPIYSINPNVKGPSWTFLNQIRISRNIPNPPELKSIYNRSAELEKELIRTCPL